MTIKGTFKNGVIVPEKPQDIAEGTSVEILVRRGPTLSETLLRFAGTIKDAPEDFARNHDHYIHGTPKK